MSPLVVVVAVYLVWVIPIENVVAVGVHFAALSGQVVRLLAEKVAT